MDAAADEVGAHVDRRAGVRGHVADAGGVGPRRRAPGSCSVGSADRPLIFTDPQSLSFGYLVAGGGGEPKTISVTVSDAGDGAGTWTAEIQAAGRVARARRVEAAPVTIAPGGSAVMQIVARASAGAVQGDNFGFVVAPARKRRAAHPVRVLGLALVARPVRR